MNTFLNYNNIVEEIKNKGYYILEDFFSNKEINNVKKSLLDTLHYIKPDDEQDLQKKYYQIKKYNLSSLPSGHVLPLAGLAQNMEWHHLSFNRPSRVGSLLLRGQSQNILEWNPTVKSHLVYSPPLPLPLASPLA